MSLAGCHCHRQVVIARGGLTPNLPEIPGQAPGRSASALAGPWRDRKVSLTSVLFVLLRGLRGAGSSAWKLGAMFLMRRLRRMQRSVRRASAMHSVSPARPSTEGLAHGLDRREGITSGPGPVHWRRRPTPWRGTGTLYTACRSGMAAMAIDKTTRPAPCVKLQPGLQRSSLPAPSPARVRRRQGARCCAAGGAWGWRGRHAGRGGARARGQRAARGILAPRKPNHCRGREKIPRPKDSMERPVEKWRRVTLS